MIKYFHKNKKQSMKYLKRFEQYTDNNTKLNIGGEGLSIFPSEFLPLNSNILELDCGVNKLKFLPELPNSLNTLYCSDNLLEYLPKLPQTLTHIDCSNNLLESLPKIPNSVEMLMCGSNKNLTELPKLPQTLSQLHCDGCGLKSLPEIPNDNVMIICNNNKWIKPLSYKWVLKSVLPAYTVDQANEFNTYEFQKSFMEETPFEWKDLNVAALKIHPKIKEEFDFIFNYDSYKLD